MDVVTVVGVLVQVVVLVVGTLGPNFWAAVRFKVRVGFSWR